MTSLEFKAWFEDFCASIGYEVPTSHQWACIRKLVARIDEKSHNPAVPLSVMSNLGRFDVMNTRVE